jgi:hypothetical protein
MFPMKTTKKMAPHLIERDGQKACSLCGAVLRANGEVTISKAFIAHVRSEHGSEPKPIEAKRA